MIILGLPDGKDTDSFCDVLIDRVNDLPTFLKGSQTCDHGTEIARHTSLAVANKSEWILTFVFLKKVKR